MAYKMSQVRIPLYLVQVGIKPLLYFVPLSGQIYGTVSQVQYKSYQDSKDKNANNKYTNNSDYNNTFLRNTST